MSQSIAVIGGGLGGLGCAALLAASGHRVTLMERNDWLGGKCRRVLHRGVVIDTGPAMLTFPRLLETFNRRWESLAGRRAEPLELIKLKGIGHYCRDDMTRELPLEPYDAGYEAWSDYASRYRGLSTILGDLLVTDPTSRSAIGPAMKMLCALGGSFSMSTWLKRARIRDAALRDIIELQALNAGGNPSQVPSLFGALLAALAVDGVFVPRGGMYNLVLHLASLLREAGGEVRTGYRVTRIRERVVSGPCGDEQFDVVVSGVDPTLTAQLTGSEQTATADLPLSCSVFAMFGSVQPAISAQRPIHQVFMPQQSAPFFSQLARGVLPESTMVFCHNYPVGHPVNPDPHHAVMAFLLTIPSGPFAAAELRAFADRQCRRVAALMGLASVSPSEDPFKELWIDTPMTVDPHYYGEFGHPSGAIYGHLVEPMASGPFHPVRHRHELPWLWQVGAGVHPGGGIPGTLGGAMIVSDKVLRALRSRSSATADNTCRPL